MDIENAPKLERKADPPKEKKKAPKAAEASGSAAAAPEKEKGKKEKKEKVAVEEPVKVSEAAPAGKAQKKEKKEKKPAEEGSSKKGGNAKAAAEDAGEPVPSMVDLRVGHIVDSKCILTTERLMSNGYPCALVMKHPDADGLYVEVCAYTYFLVDT